MRPISTRTHGYLDYLLGALLIAAPWLFGFARGGAETDVPVLLGVAIVVYSVFTAYELGLIRLLPRPVHLVLDGLGGLLLAASPWLFGFAGDVWAPHLLLGLAEFGVALLMRPGPAPAGGAGPKWALIPLGVVVALALLLAGAYFAEPEYAYLPPESKVLNRERLAAPAFDVWGRSIPAEEARRLLATAEGRRMLSPQNGAVEIDEELLELGREAFYRETFGNEVFLTDIAGMLDGPLPLRQYALALLRLRGRGTADLVVELADSATVAGRRFRKGEPIHTGLDVPRGAFAPLGMTVRFDEGRLKIGVACASCHSTVHPESKLVLEGVTNEDMNSGILLALATNSTAYFPHAEVPPGLAGVPRDAARTVTTRDGRSETLVDPEAMEDAVDAIFLRWPPGQFDSTIDLVADPTRIPHSFTRGKHPYGWSGFGLAGPFQGLGVLTNNVHAQNSDALNQAEVAPALFGLDPEVYLGTLLQNAGHPKYRYRSGSGIAPSAFFAEVDPTPGPGVNRVVVPPSFPRSTLIAPNGLFISTEEHPFWREVTAMAAWQHTLVAPAYRPAVDTSVAVRGRSVFERARCASCHAGPALTNNRIVAAPEIGTEPSRARAFARTERVFGRAVIYSFDTPVPVPPDARVLEVPTDHLDPEQVRLAWAHGGSPGGYKVPGLLSVGWHAPYLHDGGVAVGPDPERNLGMAGTLLQGIPVDPANSLRALADRDLRRRVVAANDASAVLRAVRIRGIGHEFWVDSAAGFTAEEQDALIEYLLSLGRRR